MVGQGTVEIIPELTMLAAVRIDPNEKNFFDVLEGYVRYRPVSTTPWRAGASKAGAFFPANLAREHRSRLDQPMDADALGDQFLGRR